MTMKTFYVVSDAGERVGPASLDDLAAWLKIGVIHEATLVQDAAGTVVPVNSLWQTVGPVLNAAQGSPSLAPPVIVPQVAPPVLLRQEAATAPRQPPSESNEDIVAGAKWINWTRSACSWTISINLVLNSFKIGDGLGLLLTLSGVCSWVFAIYGMFRVGTYMKRNRLPYVIGGLIPIIGIFMLWHASAILKRLVVAGGQQTAAS